uniref:Uncharacterized protein n=1 Tax=uncultured Thiotrichaceae bacterium TaxID=298394 RepID=A0A6S6U8M3_9GAMM|nr:MAG: Unknown protein [uncultured Thiotrichaceae bacterium]
MLSTASAHAAGMMPTNPMGTMFAPWNTMPGMPSGFSPMNNGFTSGGPMGMSPFSMSPFGSNGSPWGSMPSTMMPWNAWSSSPGSVVPWGNQMPMGNQMPWGGNNYRNGNQMPWGNNMMPWNGVPNYGNRNRNNNRDALSTMLLMQELNGKQGSPMLPSLSGAPAMLPPYPQPPMMPAQPQLIPQQKGFVVPSAPKVFNPFNMQQQTAPALVKTPVNTVQDTQAFSDPFANSEQVGKGQESAATAGNAAPAFNPFAQGSQPTGVQFPDADSFFIDKN